MVVVMWWRETQRKIGSAMVKSETMNNKEKEGVK